jgi:hypothetical protein
MNVLNVAETMGLMDLNQVLIPQIAEVLVTFIRI